MLQNPFPSPLPTLLPSFPYLLFFPSHTKSGHRGLGLNLFIELVIMKMRVKGRLREEYDMKDNDDGPWVVEVSFLSEKVIYSVRPQRSQLPEGLSLWPESQIQDPRS